MNADLVRVVDEAITAWWGTLDPRPTLPEAIVQAIEKKGFVITHWREAVPEPAGGWPSQQAETNDAS